jgi:C4-dicarboxylate-specific signal transduction histidine kinase
VRRKTAELERVHKTLLHSEKMASIGKLAATVAHEINNPLFGILTYARLVLRELLKHEIPGRDDLAKQLQTIERESKRCGELVKSLLTFSRQAPSIREPNDLNTVVHRAVVLVQHKLSHAEHRAGGKAGNGSAGGIVRRQPDSAGGVGADDERRRMPCPRADGSRSRPNSTRMASRAWCA